MDKEDSGIQDGGQGATIDLTDEESNGFTEIQPSLSKKYEDDDFQTGLIFTRHHDPNFCQSKGEILSERDQVSG